MDAETDAENDRTATDRAHQPESGGSDDPTDDDRPEPRNVQPAVGPGTPPRELTRPYSDVSDDDRDVGWGERPAPSGRDDDWYLRERPPHHG